MTVFVYGGIAPVGPEVGVIRASATGPVLIKGPFAYDDIDRPECNQHRNSCGSGLNQQQTQ